ncbi:hypothetical protein CKA32_005456 [Geitlerinema sp. FC II]|nr:hypothetical protein CKA32_005456 [Geitlerinema sp. FC II]
MPNSHTSGQKLQLWGVYLNVGRLPETGYLQNTGFLVFLYVGVGA